MCLLAGGRRGQYGWDRDQEPAGGLQRRRVRDRDHPTGHRDPPPEVHEGERLAHALWAQWPNYLAYLMSFLTIGVIWLNHHRIFEQVARVDGPLLLLNLNLLLWTALIPFPTAVVAEHLGGAGEAARTAAALYSGALLLGVAFWGPVRLDHPHSSPAAPAATPGIVRTVRLRFMVGQAVYAGAFALSWRVGAACPGLVGSWRCTTPSTRRRCPLNGNPVTSSPPDGQPS